MNKIKIGFLELESLARARYKNFVFLNKVARLNHNELDIKRSKVNIFKITWINVG